MTSRNPEHPNTYGFIHFKNEGDRNHAIETTKNQPVYIRSKPVRVEMPQPPRNRCVALLVSWCTNYRCPGASTHFTAVDAVTWHSRTAALSRLSRTRCQSWACLKLPLRRVAAWPRRRRSSSMTSSRRWKRMRSRSNRIALCSVTIQL